MCPRRLDHDVIVIGSGFGGAAVMLRLAEAGYDVVVLERGRRWQAPELPRPVPGATPYPRAKDDPWIFDPERPERASGWVEVRKFPGMWVVAGAGVGGGSLHFSNVSAPPAPVSFEAGWPRPFRDDPALLDPHVERVGRTLDVERLPEEQLTARSRLVRRAAEAAGLGDRFGKLDLTVRFDRDWRYERDDGVDPRSVELARWQDNEHGVPMGTCVHLGNCNIGCDVNARKILDTNYIPAAEAAGATVRPLHNVRRIEPVDGGYRVGFDRIDPEAGTREPGSLTARIVVLAAGSLASTELLLRCRDELGTLDRISPWLGHNWSPNGDFFTPSVHEEDLHLSWGPPITAAVDFVERPDAAGQRYFVQDVGFPDVLGSWLQDRRDGPPGKGLEADLLEWAGEVLDRGDEAGAGGALARLMLWFAEGQDAGDGRLRLRRKWWLFGPRSLHLDWSALRSAPTYRAIGARQQQLARAGGGEPLSPFNLGAVPVFLASFHPLGGCNLADPPGEGVAWTDRHGRQRRTDQGVVDHRGEVFGYANLFVADGAVIPEAIGRNPSRTIAAVAERIAASIVQERR